MAGIARFDLGPSLKFRDKSVADIISEGFPVSAVIGALSITLAVFVGTIMKPSSNTVSTAPTMTPAMDPKNVIQNWRIAALLLSL